MTSTVSAPIKKNECLTQIEPVSIVYMHYTALYEKGSTLAKNSVYSEGYQLGQLLTGDTFCKDLSIKIGTHLSKLNDISKQMNDIKIDNNMIRKYFFGKSAVKQFSNDIDWDLICTEIQDYINKESNKQTLQKQMNDLLKKRIQEIQEESIISTDVGDQISIINNEVNRYHDLELTKEQEVYHLYSDGEVTYQKGGNIYERRSEHPMLAPVCLPKNCKFNFPLDRITNMWGIQTIYSYAIIKKENAIRIRNMMVNLTSS
jgi:hypothetical protein